MVLGSNVLWVGVPLLPAIFATKTDEITHPTHNALPLHISHETQQQGQEAPSIAFTTEVTSLRESVCS
jgi:hypothetical protein